MLNHIKKFFGFGKKREIRIDGRVGVITPTECSLESGNNSEFLKQIIIYKGVRVTGNKITWGKKIEEKPYTEEEVLNFQKIKRIPIVERKIKNELKFYEEPPFGQVIN